MSYNIPQMRMLHHNTTSQGWDLNSFTNMFSTGSGPSPFASSSLSAVYPLLPRSACGSLPLEHPGSHNVITWYIFYMSSPQQSLGPTESYNGHMLYKILKIHDSSLSSKIHFLVQVQRFFIKFVLFCSPFRMGTILPIFHSSGQFLGSVAFSQMLLIKSV